MGRFGTPEEAAAAIAFLASDDSGFIATAARRRHHECLDGARVTPHCYEGVVKLSRRYDPVSLLRFDHAVAACGLSRCPSRALRAGCGSEPGRHTDHPFPGGPERHTAPLIAAHIGGSCTPTADEPSDGT